MKENLPRSYLASKSYRLNNFDLLRFLLALIVFLVHISALSLSPDLKYFQSFLLPKVAVQAFFIISGFLIFMSYENSSSLRDYLLKRIRRIYPGYISVIFLTVFFITIGNFDRINIDFSKSVFQYFLANSIFLNFLQPFIPGVFENNYTQIINGALWTIKIEVMFYMIVPVFALFLRRYNKAFVLFLICFFSIFYSIFIFYLIDERFIDSATQLKDQLPAQLIYFSAGGLIFYYFELFRKFFLILMFLTTAFFIFYLDLSLFFRTLQPFLLAVFVIGFATLFPYLGKFSKYGDISYGVYIIHFPIIQFFISLGLFQDSGFLGLFVTLATVIFLAFLLWHFVEKPCLNRSSHYLK
jgi:peptidoglycan/LPS O-acetylase OafA/YrhL